MRLINADALYEQAANTAENYCGFFNEMEKVISARNIEQAPTIDAVPVVRCGECKYYFGDGLGICEMIKSRLAACQRDVRWNDEFYCAYGERKDGDRDG